MSARTVSRWSFTSASPERSLPPPPPRSVPPPLRRPPRMPPRMPRRMHRPSHHAFHPRGPRMKNVQRRNEQGRTRHGGGNRASKRRVGTRASLHTTESVGRKNERAQYGRVDRGTFSRHAPAAHPRARRPRGSCSCSWLVLVARDSPNCGRTTRPSRSAHNDLDAKHRSEMFAVLQHFADRR
jgi:hypothetical protein